MNGGNASTKTTNPLIADIPIYGFSRYKILLTAAILGIILLVAVFYGVSHNNQEIPTSKQMLEGSNTHLNNENDVTDILTQVQQNQNKEQMGNARLLKNQNVAAGLHNITTAKLSAEPIATVSSVSDVPPIINMHNQNQLVSNLANIKQRHELSEVENSYNSTSAKSLLFSSVNNPASAQTESNTLNTQTVSPASNNSNGQAASDPNFNTMTHDTLNTQIKPNTSPYELKAGSVIPAIMINGINSDLPGEIIAQVRQNVYDSATRRYLLIPQGAKLIGLYDTHIIYGQERILVAWNRMIYPNGSSIDLHALPGTDISGYAGFHDLVDNKYWKIFGSSFIMGVITAGMQYSQNNTDNYVTSGGPGFYTPTVGQTLAGSLGQQLGQTGLMISEKNLNVQPTLIIRPNYPFDVMLTADLILLPIYPT